MSPPRLPRKPEARTEKVEDLVERVRRGHVRVPGFQRGLLWTASNVVDLFDSIYRGYPIGSLLFYKQPATAERLEVGTLIVDAPEISEAWWVVDGQQRITTLTACLVRSTPLPERPSRQDPYALYFDAAERKFEPPLPRGLIPSTWVPLPQLLDAARLSDWIFTWPHGQEEDLRRGVFEAGSRIREYPIPLYLIETDDNSTVEQIFYRVNKAGKPLEWTDVHKALFGSEGSSPATLEDLTEELTEVGMGRLDGKRCLTCLVALRGKDPTRTLQEHLHRDPEVLRGAVVEALPVLRRVLSFLRRDARIPHLRLLPKSILLDVLTRFFALHEDPSPRTRTLLVRWFWRTVMGAGAFDDRTLRRRGINAVGPDEEESVQKLLGLVRKERPRAYELPPTFDARADESRIALLALAHLGPADLESGATIDIAGWLEEKGRDAFVKIVPGPAPDGSRSPANRIIHQAPFYRFLRGKIAGFGIESETLATHAISPEAAECLRTEDDDRFLALRAEVLTEQVRLFVERVAEWDHNDRPSIDYLLAEAGVEL